MTVPRTNGAGEALQVEFAFTDGSYPFVRLSSEHRCSFELAAMVPRDGNEYAEFFNLVGADPERIQDQVSDHDDVQVTILRKDSTGGLLEFRVAGSCPAHRLAELGALPREIKGKNGEGRIVADVPPQYAPSEVIEGFLADHPEASLVRKYEREAFGPVYTKSTFQKALQRRLTDRQREVLDVAFEAGYYEWPRESTGEEIADELGISSATFSEHIASAERKLLTMTFDGPE